MEQGSQQAPENRNQEGKGQGNDRNRGKFRHQRRGPRPEGAKESDADAQDLDINASVSAPETEDGAEGVATEGGFGKMSRKEFYKALREKQKQRKAERRAELQAQGLDPDAVSESDEECEPKPARPQRANAEERKPQRNEQRAEGRPDRRDDRRADRKPEGNREPREPRENREPRESRPNREPREAREPREGRDNRERRQPAESEEVRAYRKQQSEESSEDYSERVSPSYGSANIGGNAFQSRSSTKGDSAIWHAKPEAKPAQKELLTIGITIGDLNGIGPETILKMAQEHELVKYFKLVVYGNNHALNKWRKVLHIEELPFLLHHDGEEFSSKKVNLVNCWPEDYEIVPGKATPESGKAAWASLQAAVADAKAGKLDAIVTAPITKANMPEEFSWPGHTEYFAEQFGGEDGLMMLCANEFRMALATVHVPLAEVPRVISTAHLEDRLAVLTKSLKEDYGITKPRIAVLGLNPHAGEEGKLGKEEQEIMVPLFEKLRNKGQLVYGPYPADGFFGARQYQQFDAVLAMYHDQGLAPFKTIAFDDGVNYTAGLPFVRTSPDHGTAYNIAGKGIADANSLRQAVYLADEIVRIRKGWR